MTDQERIEALQRQVDKMGLAMKKQAQEIEDHNETIHAIETFPRHPGRVPTRRPEGVDVGSVSKKRWGKRSIYG